MEDRKSSSWIPWEAYALPFMLPLLYHSSSHSFAIDEAGKDVETNGAPFLMTGSRATDSFPIQVHASIPASLFSSLGKDGVNPLKLHANSLVSLGSSDVTQRIKDSFS